MTSPQERPSVDQVLVPEGARQDLLPAALGHTRRETGDLLRRLPAHQHSRVRSVVQPLRLPQLYQPFYR
jgi:hypothetical protein